MTKASTKVECNDIQRILLFSDLFFIEFKMWSDIRDYFKVEKWNFEKKNARMHLDGLE